MINLRIIRILICLIMQQAILLNSSQENKKKLSHTNQRTNEVKYPQVKNSFLIVLKDKKSKISFSKRGAIRTITSSYPLLQKLNENQYIQKVKIIEKIKIEKNSLFNFHENLPQRSIFGQTPRTTTRFNKFDTIIAHLLFAKNAPQDRILKDIEKDKSVLFVEPDYLNHLSTLTPNKGDHIKKVYNLYKQQELPWWQKIIHFDLALETITQTNINKEVANLSNKEPIIAVLDSGLDIFHPAIKDRVWKNPYPGDNECGFDMYGCDTSSKLENKLGTPHINPYNTSDMGEKCPYKIVDDSEFVDPDCLHGTHISGIIAGNPIKGITGMCPICQILMIKVVDQYDGQGQVSDSSIINALKYIDILNQKNQAKVRIVNSSFGKFVHSKTIGLFIHYLKKNHDILFVAASGNENTDKPVYPAALDTVMAVTALNHEEKKADYANYGSWVNIAAPGGSQNSFYDVYGIKSSIPGFSEKMSQGTSVATPIVVGVAGLLLAINPQLSSDNLKFILEQTADRRIYSLQNNYGYNYYRYYKKPFSQGTSPQLGAGILNVENAVKHVLNNESVNNDYVANKRIKPFCGTIGSFDNKEKLSSFFILFLLAIPILVLYPSIQRRK